MGCGMWDPSQSFNLGHVTLKPLPLYGGTFQVCSGKFSFPSAFSPSNLGRQLIRRLLTRDVSSRLSSSGVRADKWFTGVDWEATIRKECPPPSSIRVKGRTDVSYFDTEWLELEAHHFSSSPPCNSSPPNDDADGGVQKHRDDWTDF